jgi:hypothetical protein
VNKLSPIVEFKDRIVDVYDLATIYLIATDVSFIRCRSNDWAEIGKGLAIFPQLDILSVEHCDSEDSLCVDLCNSKSLTSVRMGELCVTQKTAVSPIKESNIYFE